MRHYLVALAVIALLVAPSCLVIFPDQTREFVATMDKFGDQLAAVILVHKPVSVEQLKADYAAATRPGSSKVRILVVPGHEPDYGGAECCGLKEREMNVELAQDLIGFLRQSGHYDVFTTRDDQAWTPEFANYFKSGWADIQEWMKAHVSEVKTMAKVGDYKRVTPPVYHTNARPDVATRLYGINKWVDENKIDIAIHIHFNDYPGHGNRPGDYTGFTIYVPQRQFYNSTTTKAVADTVYKRLAKYNPVSDLKGEQSGIVEDQDLIAIGAFNSVDAASMLIEYGYLYEQRFQDPAVRHETLREMAYETYLGLLDFFDPTTADSVAHIYDTLAMPHTWKEPIDGKNDAVSDIFALQTALILDGDYPPAGESANDCPRSGKFGPCTKAALDSFQAKYQISGEKGVAGEKTIEALNKIYAAQTI